MAVEHPPSAAPLIGLTVRSAMRPGVITCRADDGLAAIASTMVSHGIHAVVLGWGDHASPLIVTDRDLVRAALEQPDARAADIAREPVASLPANAWLDQAVAKMAEGYVAHLLATDPESGAPVGIVSSFDLAAVAAGENPKYARMPSLGPARPSPSARSLTEARVRDVMHPGITTCPADVSLDTVARTMAQHRVHCVAVAGIARSSDHLTWGLIGDMDLVLALHRGALAEPASSIAATEPVAVEEDESFDRVAALMVDHDTSHVVVIGRSGQPAGMVSTHDVASVLAASA